MISFLKEFKCQFSKRPSAFEYHNNAYYIALKNNTIYRMDSTNKEKSFRLNKIFAMEKREYPKLLTHTREGELLIITNRLSFFMISYEPSSFDIKTTNTLPFKYKDSLSFSRSSVNRFIKAGNSSFFISGRFVFQYIEKTREFKLFKLFNSKVLDFQFKFSVKSLLWVLTEKKLMLIEIERNDAFMVPKVVNTIENTNLSKITVVQDSLCTLSNKGGLQVLDQYKLTPTKTISLSDANSEIVSLVGLFSISHTRLAIYTSDHILILNNGLNRIVNIIPIKQTNHLFSDQLHIDFERKSENSINLSLIRSISYNEHNKYQKYNSLNSDDKLDCVFSYLMELFLQKREIKNYNTTIHNMLTELNLGALILKHKRFKEKVISFFKLIKEFTLYEKRNNKKMYKINGPVVMCNDLIKPKTASSSLKQKKVDSIKKARERFDYAVFKPQYNEREWTIIKNNMRRDVVFSTDTVENERMKYVMAQNRVFRLLSGERAARKTLDKQGPLIPKINTLFHYFEKFQMKKSQRILWFEVNKFHLYRLLYIRLPIPKDWIELNKSIEQFNSI